MTIVANGQVQIAVTVIIAPGHTPGISTDCPEVDEEPFVPSVITIYLIDLVSIPNSQVQVTVAIIITPGHAGRGFCVPNGLERHEMAGPVIAINLIGLRLTILVKVTISYGQVQITVAIIITPGHAGRDHFIAALKAYVI